MKKLFAFLLLGLIFAGCNPEKRYAEQITEINNLQVGLDSLEDLFESIKFDSLIMIQTSALDAEKSMKMYYTADTVSQDLAKKMQFIKSVRKGLNNIAIKEKSISKEISVLGNQFTTLKQDVKEGLLKEEQVNVFLKAEKEAFENLESSINNVLELQEKHLKDFNFAIPVVSEYIELIKPKDYQE